MVAAGRGLTARQRVCRMQLLRRYSAREHANSIAEVGEDPGVAGKETVAAIEADCHDLGLAGFTQDGYKLEGQTRLRYTKRMKEFADDLGFQGGYSIYSGVAHGELAGVWRLFGETGATVPGRDPIYGPAANPEASFAAASGALRSMMGPVGGILLLAWTSVAGATMRGQWENWEPDQISNLPPKDSSQK